MKERPILFSAPMVRAILDGKKSQTRRVVKIQPDSSEISGAGVCDTDDKGRTLWHWMTRARTVRNPHFVCPYGAGRDRLWVKETYSLGRANFKTDGIRSPKTRNGATQPAIYRANRLYNDEDFKWRPSIFMPRWASRITIEIVSVRVERLQDISEDDAKAEGCSTRTPIDDFRVDSSGFDGSRRGAYRDLWNSINGDGSWDLNPFVWVIGFQKIEERHPITEWTPGEATFR